MTLPTLSFAPTQVKPRFGEHYISEASNTKFLGQPRGIYTGFVPQLTPDSLVLTLGVDPSYGLSLARVKSSLEDTNVDVVTTAPVTIDFTGFNFTATPTVYVKVHAFSKLGSPTTAEVYTTATSGSTPTDQLICVVTLPSPNTLAVANDAPNNQATPFAFSSAPLGYGFMQSGAVEQLLASVAMVAEVAAARVDLLGITHPYSPPTEQGLSDRIAADLNPAAVANRLGMLLRVIRSNDYVITTTTGSVNVSSSFAKAGRTREPFLTIPPAGSETSAGAITNPPDAVRNIAFVFTVGPNERVIDSNRTVNYGRLVSNVQTLTGTLTFSNTGTTVTGSGTAFTTQTQPGDIILAPDGEYYVITTVTNDTTLILTSIPTIGGTITSLRSRFVLNIVKIDPVTLVELPGSVIGGTTIRFFCSAYFTTAQSIHDATLLMFEGGEEPVLPTATAAVAGQAQLDPMLPVGIPGLAGAIRVLNSGSPVGSGKPAYSLGFHSPPGQPSIPGASLGSPGIADVSAAGPIGPIGAPGTGPGPPGPTGAPGLGFNSFSTPYEASSLFTPPFGGWAANQVLTFDFEFLGPVKYLHGGIATWYIPASEGTSNDQFDITTVTLVTSTTGRIQNTIGTPSGSIVQVQLFLNGAG